MPAYPPSLLSLLPAVRRPCTCGLAAKRPVVLLTADCLVRTHNPHMSDYPVAIMHDRAQDLSPVATAIASKINENYSNAVVLMVI